MRCMAALSFTAVLCAIVVILYLLCALLLIHYTTACTQRTSVEQPVWCSFAQFLVSCGVV